MSFPIPQDEWVVGEDTVWPLSSPSTFSLLFSVLPPTAEPDSCLWPYRIRGGSTATVNCLLTVRSYCPYLVRRKVWWCGWIRIH